MPENDLPDPAEDKRVEVTEKTTEPAEKVTEVTKTVEPASSEE